MGAFPILDALFPIVGNVLDRIIPDKAAAEKAKSDMQLALVNAAIQGQLAQLEVNKAEAANPRLFVSGARPFIMWVCGSALAFQYVVSPIGLWIGNIAGHPLPVPPTLDEHLWELMVGMLGMAGWRSWDKKNGVASQ